MDRRIQEWEEEIRKLSPEEEIIMEDTLIKATKAVNDKIRSKNFLANEILFWQEARSVGNSNPRQRIRVKNQKFSR